jgi:hypothetical protein
MSDTKFCTSCGEDKELTCFYKNKARKDGLDVYCKECSKKRRKQRLSTEEGQRKHREQGRKWREANPEKSREMSQRWRDGNREKLASMRKTEERRAYNRAYVAKRRKDPVFRMRCNVSRNISFALFRSGGSKRGESVLRHLPYTIEDLRKHLESQFDENMNWENYGSYWNIDHIYPQSLLPYLSMEDENFLKCWALENLRPLEVVENIKKSNKLTIKR